MPARGEEGLSQVMTGVQRQEGLEKSDVQSWRSEERRMSKRVRERGCKGVGGVVVKQATQKVEPGDAKLWESSASQRFVVRDGEGQAPRCRMVRDARVEVRPADESPAAGIQGGKVSAGRACSPGQGIGGQRALRWR